MAVPSEQWNDASVWGAFAAKDPSRRRRYDVHCQLSNRHLSEGLFERETRLQATLQPSESSP